MYAAITLCWYQIAVISIFHAFDGGSAFTVNPMHHRTWQPGTRRQELTGQLGNASQRCNQLLRNPTLFATSQSVTSPFEKLGEKLQRGGKKGNSALPLTLENVDLVLEEVRPYLMADGGNCAIHHIDGPIVYLKLEGACGSCPSSTVTVKMGIERKLKERIPEVERVEAVSEVSGGVGLTEESVEKVLDGVRPFLRVTGGDIKLVKLHAPIEGVANSLRLKLTGNLSGGISSSVKVEIRQRLQRNFPTLMDVKIEDDPLD